jgi:hypothetical protein
MDWTISETGVAPLPKRGMCAVNLHTLAFFFTNAAVDFDLVKDTQIESSCRLDF